VLSLKDGSVKRILTLPTYEGYPDWSRDGRFVYFTSRDPAGTIVQRVAMNGSACRKPPG
jgi:Tol biopolymer transport system component